MTVHFIADEGEHRAACGVKLNRTQGVQSLWEWMCLKYDTSLVRCVECADEISTDSVFEPRP